MLERKSRILNRLYEHRAFGAEATSVMLRTDTDITIEEISPFCLEIGMKRAKILRIGIAFSETPDELRRFGQAFRAIFSGMSNGALAKLLRAHIVEPANLDAVLDGVRKAQTA